MGMIQTMGVLLNTLFSKPITVQFPREAIEIPEGYRGEQEYDIDNCISCSLCSQICLNKAIEMVEMPEEYKEKYPKKYPKIDLRKCCFCALCQDICPKKCLRMTINVLLATPDPTTVVKNPMPKGGGAI